MADMSVEEALEKYGPSEITRDDVLELDDPAFAPGNVALVTGAASGIGRATALALAGNGLTVVGFDVDGEGLREARDRADALDLPGEIHVQEGDLTDDGDCEAAVEAATDAGDLTFLANIAGIQHVAPLPEFPMEKYDRIHDIMLRAPLLLSKLAYPHMEDAGGGAVGNMASVHGHVVTKEKVAYNTVKHGIRGLTNSTAAEDGDTRAFSVSTAYVKTELVARQLPDSADSRGLTVDETVEQVMLGHTRADEMMEPVEVANLFVFGFSEHSAHLNAGDMLHDGGMVHTYE